MSMPFQVQHQRHDKLNFIKIKNFYLSKDTVKKMKRQVTEWVKILANHIADKGLIFRICKEVLQISNAKT